LAIEAIFQHLFACDHDNSPATFPRDSPNICSLIIHAPVFGY